MKRIICALVALVMAFTSVGFAQGTDTLTAETLLGELLEGFAGILQRGEFAFEYTEGENRLSAGLLEDAWGMPVIEGEISENGETAGASVSREGVVLSMPGMKEGMAWVDIISLGLKEMGLDGVMDVTEADIALISGMLADVVANISPDALSGDVTEDLLNGVDARKLTLRMDVGSFLRDLDAAVSATLSKNAGALDEMFARLDKLFRQTVPGLSGMTAEELIAGWTGLGLSDIPALGMRVTVTFTYTGGITSPWKMDLSTFGMGIEAWFDGEAVCLEINRIAGEKLVFDSRDAEYVLELILSGIDGITREAFDVSREVSGGMCRVNASVNFTRLRRQMLSGLIDEISARREEVDALIARYRPWAALVNPDASGANVDNLLAMLSKRYADAGATPYYLWQLYRIGNGKVFTDSMNFSLSYPVRQPNGGDTVRAGGFFGFGGPVSLTAGNGMTDIVFHLDDTALEASITDLRQGMKRALTAETDRDGRALTAKYSYGFAHVSRAYWYYALEADETGMRLYDDDGDVDIRVVFTENGADISGTVDDDPFTGSIIAQRGLWKLTLSDDYRTNSAVLSSDDDGFEFETDFFGSAFALKCDMSNGFSGEIRTGYSSFSFERITGANWAELGLSAKTSRLNYSAGARVDERGVSGRLTGQMYRLGINTDVEFTISRNTPEIYLSVKDARQIVHEIRYRPGNLTIANRRNVITISDVTPAGSADRNEISITVYYPNASSLDDAYWRYALVTDKLGSRYSVTFSEEDAVLWSAKLDFNPDPVQPETEGVLWLTPEMFLLKYEADAIFNDYSQTEASGEAAEGAQATESVNIARVQRQLVQTGFLPADKCSGAYDEATAAAISQFQMWINETRGQESLAVTGEADALTVACLKYCVDRWLSR